jgi:polysaccharide export outer membrane protein
MEARSLEVSNDFEPNRCNAQALRITLKSISLPYYMRFPLLFLFTLTLFSSCYFRSNLMLKTPRHFNYDQLVDSLSRLDYRIAKNDAVAYRIFTNNGFKLIDLATSNSAVFRNDNDVIVESDGFVKMPLLGRIHLSGLTIREAEQLMEERYAKFYVEPFVNLRITNKRVIVFPGNGGLAKVLPLANNNTSVMEALANAGGVLEDGKAYKVKLIRLNPDPQKMPYVYLLDLSHIEGVKMGNSIVQAGDIIYVEPRYRPLATFTREAAPVITLLTTAIIAYQLTVLIRR